MKENVKKLGFKITILLIGLVLVAGCANTATTPVVVTPKNMVDIKMIYVPGDYGSERVSDQIDILANTNPDHIRSERWGFGDENMPEEYKEVTEDQLPVVFINGERNIHFTTGDMGLVEKAL